MAEGWSFALINDIHLGAFHMGYGGLGFADGDSGQEYFLTDRLRRTVDWINANADALGIRFVAVLGDITDSAQESEFHMARRILDSLAMPYVPLFGNHDVWPYSLHHHANGPSGSEVFNSVFAGAFARLSSSKALREWGRDAATVSSSLLNNYTFECEGVRFIALDTVSREAAPNGVGANGRGVFHAPTEKWLRDHLASSPSSAPVVLLSHHPLSNGIARPAEVGGFEWRLIGPLLQVSLPSDEDCARLRACLDGHTGVRAAFAGHSHSVELLLGNLPTPPFIWDFDRISFQPVGNVPVQLTEALEAGSNGPEGQDKGTIRIVKVGDGSSLDGTTLAGPETPSASNHALNPSFDATVAEGYGMFRPHRFSKQAAEFRFDYGDGATSGDFQAFRGGWWERTNLLDSEAHRFEDGKESHLVTLDVRESLPGGGYFTERISREVYELA
jgi:hypothetical protein